MPLVLGFALFGAAALIITKALVPGASFADVLNGSVGQIYRTDQTATAAAPSSAASTAGTAGGSVPSTPTGGYTQRTWAIALLSGLGIRPTEQAISNIIRWEAGEGGNWDNTATYNPLNTTQVPASGGYSNTGTQGNIKAYTSWEQGLQATITTLRNGDYGAILAAIPGDSGTFDQAVDSSVWGTHDL